jgi:hypothetical protein
MPNFRYFSVVGSALLALLFVSDALFGDNSRFEGSLYESAIYAPQLVEIAAAQERQFPRNATPADRVKAVFGQFVRNEGRRGQRYSAI